MKEIKNAGHSAYSKLLDISKNRKEDFSYILNRYAAERFLYRLSISQYSQKFLLKGASLFLVWKKNSFRVTRDTDLLGIGDYNLDRLIGIFKEICLIETAQDDGIKFLPETIKGLPIRAEMEYGGIRINLDCRLHSAKISLQIDIGFGDIVIPSPEKVNYPVLLDFEAPVLNAYTRYTVVAEKFEAIVRLGMANSRIKDFYDLWILKNSFEFSSETLEKAIAETFKRRKTEIPNDIPVSFTSKFYDDPQKTAQWKAFVKKIKAETGSLSFSQIIAEISEFIMPVIRSILNLQRNVPLK
ncbi:MAG: nucleotidyl transferase AbiEii/AbiGii toxin family protein [bacterium]